MRLYELYENAIADGTKQMLNGVEYTWNSIRNRWIDSRGVQAGGGATVQLMKSMGLDPQGKPLPAKKDSMLSKAQRAIDRKIGGSLSGGIDPDATMLGKAMGHVGAAIGRGMAKVIAPKQATQPVKKDQ